VELVEGQGAEALTMRRLADQMGTALSSLYRHVASREEVLTLVVDAVLGGLTMSEAAGGDWQATLRLNAHLFRHHLLTHDNVVPLISETQMLGPNAMHQREIYLTVFIGAGFDPATAVRSYLAIVHFTIANVQLNLREAAGSQDRRRALRRLFAGQDPSILPTVVAHATALADHDSDAEFDFGLEALIDGIDKLAHPDEAGGKGKGGAGP